ncbi:MAG: hypothetical protein WC933_02930 [Candidatus Paceibacterota bacterium]|jgi:hypothetical protein
MFTIKYFGISFDHHEAISNIVCENDKNCHKIVHHSKNIFSKIKFENFHRLTVNIADYIKKKIIYLKRRFDSKQPAFFLSPQKPSHVKKNSVSFFLKNVTDYKNSLKKKDL